MQLDRTRDAEIQSFKFQSSGPRRSRGTRTSEVEAAEVSDGIRVACFITSKTALAVVSL